MRYVEHIHCTYIDWSSAKMSEDGTFTPWRTESRQMPWRTCLDGKTRGYHVKIPFLENACPYYWKPVFCLLVLRVFFFEPFLLFAFRSTAVVYVHDMSMCWSRFVLICLFASRFPADHRTKNNWLRTSSEVESRDEKRQLPVIWYSSRISSPVPTCYKLTSTCNQQASSTLRALAALFGSGITSKKLRRSSLQTGGERFPSPGKATMVVWCFYCLLSVCLPRPRCCCAVLVLWCWHAARSRKQHQKQ